MDVILYSTGCPKCSVLEKKLSSTGIEYEIVNDADLMIAKGFTSIPMLEVDGKALDFKKALEWVNNKQEQ